MGQVQDAEAERVKYHCKHCGKTVERASTKKWIRSWCATVGKLVHLMRVSNHEKSTNRTTR